MDNGLVLIPFQCLSKDHRTRDALELSTHSEVCLYVFDVSISYNPQAPSTSPNPISYNISRTCDTLSGISSQVPPFHHSKPKRKRTPDTMCTCRPYISCGFFSKRSTT